MTNNVTTTLKQQSNHSTNPVLINLTQCCMHVVNGKFLQHDVITYNVTSYVPLPYPCRPA